MSSSGMKFLLQPGKERANQICEAWLEGCGGGEIVDKLDVDEQQPVAFFGVAIETIESVAKLLWRGRDFYYIDNGYFPFRHGSRELHFRVTKNATQHLGVGRPDYDRFATFDPGIKLNRTPGNHVLIACQTEWWYAQNGMKFETWLRRIIRDVADNTERTIIVRMKPNIGGRLKYRTDLENMVLDYGAMLDKGEKPLDLTDTWAVVTHTSNCAIEAIFQGIPVFVTGLCAAEPLARRDVRMIEEPYYPHLDEVVNWGSVLAANQWTMKEMREGLCWRKLQEKNYAEPI